MKISINKSALTNNERLEALKAIGKMQRCNAIRSMKTDSGIVISCNK